LWCNNPELTSDTENLRKQGFFLNESLPLKSGIYSLKKDGGVFTCRVINYSEYEMYVLQIEKSDVLSSFIRNEPVQEFLINQSGTVRQAVTGITVSGNMLQKILEQSELYSEEKYLEVIMGNCYKLLRSVMNTNELIRYSDGSIERKHIDVSRVINEFSAVCREILSPGITLKHTVEKNLFITADPERFTTCLLSMVVFVNGKDPLNDLIFLSCEKIGQWVSITIKSKRSGKEYENRNFSRQSLLYDNGVDSDVSVIESFCQEFGGTFFTSAEGEGKSCSIKLPFCSDNPEAAEFNSSISPYPTEKFSKYHIALSDIVDILYY
jgi:hypothetical protein